MRLDAKYVRATNASGTAWGTPVTVDSVGNVGQYNALAIIGGNPAIFYYDVGNANLKLVRALDANGATWMTPVTLNNTGSVGTYVSAIQSTSGIHVVTFYDATSGELKFLRLLPVAAPLRVNWIALPP